MLQEDVGCWWTMTQGSGGSRGEGYFVLGENVEARGHRGQASHTQTLASAISTWEMLHHSELQGRGTRRRGQTPEPHRKDPDVRGANAVVSSLGGDSMVVTTLRCQPGSGKINDFFFHEQVAFGSIFWKKKSNLQ